MPTVSPAPYLPLITDNRPYPVLHLQENGIILRANHSARQCGLREGMSVASLLFAEEIPRHTACLRRSTDTCYDPLENPQNSAVYPIKGIDGFTVLYVEYVYTLKSTVMHAALFPGRREYLNAVTRTSRGTSSLCQFLRRYTPSRTYGWHAMLDARAVPAMDRRLAAATLALNCVEAACRGEEQDMLFSLRHVMEIFTAEVLPYLHAVDSRVEFAPLPAGETFTRLEPDSFFLLIASLLCGMDALSDDRKIRVECTHCADFSLLCFTTECSRMSRLLIRCADMQALAPAAPHRKHL